MRGAFRSFYLPGLGVPVFGAYHGPGTRAAAYSDNNEVEEGGAASGKSVEAPVAGAR